MMTQEDEQLHGFSLTRTMPAEPGEVFSYFTDAEKFARSLVVPGYLTPASPGLSASTRDRVGRLMG